MIPLSLTKADRGFGSGFLFRNTPRAPRHDDTCAVARFFELFPSLILRNQTHILNSFFLNIDRLLLLIALDISLI